MKKTSKTKHPGYLGEVPALLDAPIIMNKEARASVFLTRLMQDGFMGRYKVFLSNYIGGKTSIALKHIKDRYMDYVCDGSWTEEKLISVIIHSAKKGESFSESNMLRHGVSFDEGKVTKVTLPPLSEKTRGRKTIEQLSEEFETKSAKKKELAPEDMTVEEQRELLRSLLGDM